MKLHRAAAGALVAWILIVPPQLGGDGHTDKAVPLAQWEQMGSYNSEADCRADCESFIKRDEKEYKLSLGSRATPSAVSPDSARQARLKSTAALCVSDDDPRLKKK